MPNWNPKYSLFIGRWQPFHDGHAALIQNVLDRGGYPLIAIRDTQESEDNPFSVEQRQKMIHDRFGSRVRTMVIPDIEGVYYGRKVGYNVERIELDVDLEAISGTKIRGELNK